MFTLFIIGCLALVPVLWLSLRRIEHRLRAERATGIMLTAALYDQCIEHFKREPSLPEWHEWFQKRMELQKTKFEFE